MNNKLMEKLNTYICNEQKEKIDEKDYEIIASDTAMTGKIVIELGQLPRNLQKIAINKLKSGDYTIDDIASWLVINT